MASRGDAVECRKCGAVLRLDNDRVPWHKRPGTRFNCNLSGVPADGWDAASVVFMDGMPFVLACPECGARSGISPAAEGEIACGRCGVAGPAIGFFRDAMERMWKAKPEPVMTRRFRG